MAKPPQRDVADKRDVAFWFDAGIALQFDLCRAVEAVADSLPSRIDTHAAILLAEGMQATLVRCHRLEETLIFPILRISHRRFGHVLDRLSAEHVEDEDQAAEMGDALKMLVAGQTGVSAAEVGYMLRGLFTPLRRHLAFERETILPLYRRTCGLRAVRDPRPPPRPRHRPPSHGGSA